MQKSDGASFRDWFSDVSNQVEEQTGIAFHDEESVRGDYENDVDSGDVIDDIVSDYTD